jgi:hypothetical protein
VIAAGQEGGHHNGGSIVEFAQHFGGCRAENVDERDVHRCIK